MYILPVGRNSDSVFRHFDVAEAMVNLVVENAIAIPPYVSAVPDTMAEAFVSLQRLNIITAETADKMRRFVLYRSIARHHLIDFKQYISQVMSDCYDN